MKHLLVILALAFSTSVASAQVALAPQGEWSAAIARGELRATTPTQERPSKDAGKSIAQIQREADEGWAYARRLHPSWGKR